MNQKQPQDILEVKRSYIYFAITLSLACAVSLAASAYWPHLYAGHAPTPDAHVPKKLAHFLFPFLCLTVFTFHLPEHDASPFGYKKKFTWLIKVWWFALFPLGYIAIVQFFTGIFKRQVIPTSPDFYHATLLFGHHLSTASIIIFPTFTALAVALGIWHRSKTIARFEWSVAMAGLLILFLSFARTAWLVMPLGVMLIIYFSLRGTAVKAKTVLFGFLIVVLGLFAAVQSPVVQERLQRNMGIQERFKLWEANIDYFKNRPVTGIGFLKTQEMSEFYFKETAPDHYKRIQWGHAHSNFFEMLGGAGLLGLMTFLAWIGFSLQFAFQTAQRARAAKEFFFADFALGIGVALILMHINGLTQVNFWEGKVFHQQMLVLSFLMMIRFTIARQAENNKP